MNTDELANPDRLYSVLKQTRPPGNARLWDGGTYQFLEGVNIVEDAAVLHGALHSTGPQGLGHWGQRDHALTTAFCQHVTLHLLPTGLCHVRAVVDHEGRLVGD